MKSKTHNNVDNGTLLIDKLLKKLGLRRMQRGKNTLLNRIEEATEQDDSTSRSMLPIIEATLSSSDVQAREIMVPRAQMRAISINDKRLKILQTVIDSGHSRFPVVNADGKEVIGILLAKDLIPFLLETGEADIKLAEVMRPVTKIPESKRLLILLNEFREQRNHMAIVYDEYGDIAGLVTIEDVLEEIVGEIEDEHDKESDGNIVELAPNTWSIRAITPIEDFNAHFSAKLDDDEFDTIGGLILQALQRIPRRDESIEIDGFSFTVMQADRRRIHLLRLKR